MKTYTLYFEFFGRNMKTTVEADSCQEAKELVADRVNFISIYENEEKWRQGDGERGRGGEEDPAVKRIFDLFKGFKK